MSETKRTPRAPKLEKNTLCTWCFKAVSPNEEYEWARLKGGGCAFMHTACWKKVPKYGDSRRK